MGRSEKWRILSGNSVQCVLATERVEEEEIEVDSFEIDANSLAKARMCSFASMLLIPSNMPTPCSIDVLREGKALQYSAAYLASNMRSGNDNDFKVVAEDNNFKVEVADVGARSFPAWLCLPFFLFLFVCLPLIVFSPSLLSALITSGKE